MSHLTKRALLMTGIWVSFGMIAPRFASSKQIGSMTPPPSITEAQLTDLAPEQAIAWSDYLANSKAQMAADKAALSAERAELFLVPPPPKDGHAEDTMPLDRPASWYATHEAIAVANEILSFQTPAGGWGKNQPRGQGNRQKGQAYVIAEGAPFDPSNKAIGEWKYVGTIDNEATTTEIYFLAKVATNIDATKAQPYRDCVNRGLGYLIAAQYPNGGWPQIWPLQGGYHDAATLNDQATTRVLRLLLSAAQGQDDFAFMKAPQRDIYLAAYNRGLDCILSMQCRLNDRKTLWAQQYDAITLTPCGARNFEPIALATAESCDLLLFLMSLKAPTPAIIDAVESGVACLKGLSVDEKVWEARSKEEGRKLYTHAGAEPLWARYYDLATLKPIFGDRDRSIHDDVNDLSLERRNGYSWFNKDPLKVFKAYSEWAKK